MGSLRGALAASGIVKQEVVDELDEKDREEREKEFKKKVESMTSTGRFQSRKPNISRGPSSESPKKDRRADPEWQKRKEELKKRSEPFDLLWRGERSRKFMIHVLRTFLPPPIVKFVGDWSDKEFKSKNCCICKNESISLEDAIKASGEVAKAMVEAFPKMLDDPKYKMPDVMEGKKLAVQAPDSNAVFCAPCYREFIRWALFKSGVDNSLARVVSSVRKKYQKSKDNAG